MKKSFTATCISAEMVGSLTLLCKHLESLGNGMEWNGASSIKPSNKPENQFLTLQQLDIAFYGDSILETWRGTDMGRDCRRCDGGPDIFLKYFGSRYKAHVFAVGGQSLRVLGFKRIILLSLSSDTFILFS